MLNRLSRILLALLTAFVFSGQMEAAAEHCARLAHEAVQAVEPAEAAPCHETADAAAMSHDQPVHHGKTRHHESPTHAPDHCECIAALNGWSAITGASESSRVASYAWLTPGAVQFASSEPDPDLRPPRA